MALWDRISSRGRVDDRRGMAPTVGGLGLGGVALYLLFSVITGSPIDVGDVLGQLDQIQVPDASEQDRARFEGEDDYEVFASTVLGSANDMWESVFRSNNQQYSPPTLVLFRTATKSACGTATSQVGPHYCSLDKTIYLDETFFEEMKRWFGAEGGDVAEAYVIAHEVAHHAQHELGILDEVSRLTQQNSRQAQELAIALELQADCFAGLWAHSIKDLGVFLPGEIKEAMDAAEAVGDDRIQEKVTGQVNPETWTHGSSLQRLEWFNRGYESGNLAACETFN